MKRKLTVTITQSRRQVTTLTAATTSRQCCPTCGREVATLSPAQAAEQLMIVAGRSSEDLMTVSRAHAIQSEGDDPRVCEDPLSTE
jgi:hypothetical protein